MKSAILLIAALAIAAPIVTPALAQVDPQKIQEACQDKQPGDTVVVDGQEVTCP